MILKLLLIVYLISATSAGKLPIQAHSFNDFNYLQNLIRKGIDHFKLDISMANRQSCQQYSTWNRTSKCIQISEYVEEICCLAFRGDASSRPNFEFQFNTTQQYLTLMDNTLRDVVANQPNRRLLFAINFQYDHSFDDFFTENFLGSLADLMAKYPNNLLLGTGSDNFILEYDRICFGKGAPQCNDLRRKISKSNIFLQSGANNPFDHRDYYKRYRNFNIFYKGIQNHCQNGFPDWISKYPEFPLIFWQPSNEKQIQYVLSHFLSPTCMKKHGRTLSGMAIATNIDSEMFDIYSKTITEFVSSNSVTHLQQVDAPAAAFNYSNQKLFINGEQMVRLASQTFGSGQSIFSASINSNYRNKLILRRWESDQKAKTIKISAIREFASLISDGEILDNLMTDGVGHIVVVTSTPLTSSSTVYYFDNITLEVVNLKKWQKIYGSYMNEQELIYISCNDSSLTNCSITGAIQLKKTYVYASFLANLFFKSITSLEEYNDGYIIVGNSHAIVDLTVALVIKGGMAIVPEIPLGLGSNPKIFRKKSGKEYGVLIHNGMCHSALLINNNDMNKCNFFQSPQFRSLRSVRGLVHLIEFDLKNLLKNRNVITPCLPQISLTKLMNGVDSDILELPSLGSYLISSGYLRIEDQDLTAALFCGGSNFDKQFQNRQKSSLLSTFLLSNREDSARNSHPSVEQLQS